jgi:hypothetical protein
MNWRAGRSVNGSSPAGDMRMALGCMRLTTDADRDETRAVATLHAAFDAGLILFDTRELTGATTRRWAMASGCSRTPFASGPTPLRACAS